MTATQSTQRHGATLRRAACRAAAALRAIHDEPAAAAAGQPRQRLKRK